MSMQSHLSQMPKEVAKKNKNTPHSTKDKQSLYFVYIVECADGTLYTGSTNNLNKRVEMHNTGKTGAKYTKTRRPVKLVYSELCPSKGDALKREWKIKKLTRDDKLKFVRHSTT